MVRFMKFEYEKYKQYFSEGKFWEKLKAVAKKAGLKVTAYALILFYILDKDEVPTHDKALIIGCLGYFILPIDLIPDLTPLGYSDDIVAMLFTIRRCIRYIDDDVKMKVMIKLKSWFNVDDDYLFELLNEIKK